VGTLCSLMSLVAYTLTSTFAVLGCLWLQDLKATMAGLLRLHMSLQNEAQADEQVRWPPVHSRLHWGA
jgi:hypothetical protein